MEILNVIKKITFTALLCVFSLVSIPAIEVFAESFVIPIVVVVHEYAPNQHNYIEGVEFTLYHNNDHIFTSSSSSFGEAMLSSALLRSDIADMEVRLINGNGWVSDLQVVPLNSFNDMGQWFEFYWHVTPATTEATDPTPPVLQALPPATPPTDPTPSIPWQRILRFAIDSKTFTNAGTPETLEAAPFIANDRTMVPLRVIGEALGATDLAFNDGVITFAISGQAFTMTVGQELPNNMGTPIIVSERTFVPLGFIVNEMGATARWDAAERAAYIYIS